jgi:hypothetical protein
MRRVLTALSLCVAAFAFGCQAEPPSRACACPKGSGCQCPLSGPQHASGTNQGRAKPAKQEEHVARREHHRRHQEARAERGRHLKNHGSLTQRREAAREAQEGEYSEQSGGALQHGYGAMPYGYHSQSHSYSKREGRRPAEVYGSEEEYAHGTHRHSHRMHRRTDERGYGPGDDESGSVYGEGYGPEVERGQEYGSEARDARGYSDGPEEAVPSEANPTGVNQMSINSPTTLDSWHGYGVDCPEPR